VKLFSFAAVALNENGLRVAGLVSTINGCWYAPRPSWNKTLWSCRQRFVRRRLMFIPPFPVYINTAQVDNPIDAVYRIVVQCKRRKKEHRKGLPMTDDAHEERFRQHQEMIEALAKIWMPQSETNERLDATIAELKGFNRQQVEINADIKTTLARTFRPEDNGRDA
jgi:hypothetical protein